MVRNMVDLPQPDGPTIVTNSPISGKSSTTKETFSMAIFALGPWPKDLVTFLNTTTSGRAVFCGSAAGRGAPAGAVSFAPWAGCWGEPGGALVGEDFSVSLKVIP